MFTVIFIMLCGVCAGYLLRGRKLKFTGPLTNVFIWILLFLLGVEVGCDERIISGLTILGIEGIAIALAGVAGCGALSLLLWKITMRS